MQFKVTNFMNKVSLILIENFFFVYLQNFIYDLFLIGLPKTSSQLMNIIKMICKKDIKTQED